MRKTTTDDSVIAYLRGDILGWTFIYNAPKDPPKKKLEWVADLFLAVLESLSEFHRSRKLRMRYWIGDTSSKDALYATDQGGSTEFKVTPPVTKNDLSSPFNSKEFPTDSQWISNITVRRCDVMFTLPGGNKWINRNSAEFGTVNNHASDLVHDPLVVSMSFGICDNTLSISIWSHTDYWMGDSEVAIINRERLIRALNEVYELAPVDRVEYDYHKYSTEELIEMGFPDKFFDDHA
jgi:hypothetical protein